MFQLGIDDSHGLIYEGTGNYGRAIWPTPIITPAKFIFLSEEAASAESSSAMPTEWCRFREEYYDPITRVRRGRFYFAEGAQPAEWRLQPHPAEPLDPHMGKTWFQKKRLFTLHGNSIWHKFFKGRTELPIVALGVDDRFTLWSVVGVEGMYSREDLVTLKAHSTLGVLPIVDYSQVPEGYQDALRESLEAFVDDVHRAAPNSVVDRAREAASQIVISYFELSGRDVKDLGGLATRLEKEGKVLAANAARIINRLHPRGKASEKARRDLRPIRAQDAELAVKCVGTILCELEWADWP